MSRIWDCDPQTSFHMDYKKILSSVSVPILGMFVCVHTFLLMQLRRTQTQITYRAVADAGLGYSSAQSHTTALAPEG